MRAFKLEIGTAEKKVKIRFSQFFFRQRLARSFHNFSQLMVFDRKQVGLPFIFIAWLKNRSLWIFPLNTLLHFVGSYLAERLRSKRLELNHHACFTQYLLVGFFAVIKINYSAIAHSGAWASKCHENASRNHQKILCGATKTISLFFSATLSLVFWFHLPSNHIYIMQKYQNHKLTGLKAKSVNQLLCWHHKRLSAKHFDISKMMNLLLTIPFFGSSLSFFFMLSVYYYCYVISFDFIADAEVYIALECLRPFKRRWSGSAHFQEKLRKKCNHLFEWIHSLVIAHCSVTFPSALPWGRNKGIKWKQQTLDRSSIYRMENWNVLFLLSLALLRLGTQTRVYLLNAQR